MNILGVRVCEVDGCCEPHWAKGCCNLHYQRRKRLGQFELPEKDTICSTDGCGGLRVRMGMCHNCSEREYYKTRPLRIRK